MKTKLVTIVALAALSFTACHATAQGQTDAETGTPLVLPRPDYHFSGNVGRTYLDSAKPQFPQPVQAPKGAPNIVLILIDDAGFGQFSTFGGGIPSPTMDKLAAEGLRYNRFHTTALCSPTRAALITGRNHHSSATGVIAELATGYDGYTTVIPRSHGSVGEVLRQNGYMTAWIGKNHSRHPQPDDHIVARKDQGGRTSGSVHARDRRRPDHLRGDRRHRADGTQRSAAGADRGG